MLWFYVLQDQCQPYCLTELGLHSRSTKKNQRTNDNFKAFKADLAVGFEKGLIKLYDLSEHFQSTRLDEVNQSFLMHQN